MRYRIRGSGRRRGGGLVIRGFRLSRGSRGRGRGAGEEIGGFAAHKGSFPERGFRPLGVAEPDVAARRTGRARLCTSCLIAPPRCPAGSCTPNPVSAGEAEGPKRSQAAGVAAWISAPFPVLRATFVVGVRGDE